MMSAKPVEAVGEFVLDHLNDEVDFGGIHNQIITPTKVGWVGSIALNGSLQTLMQPSKKNYFEIERHKWEDEQYARVYEQDKVIFTVNNYDLGLFNGETGVITKLCDDGGITVDFGDKDVTIPVSMEVQSRSGMYYYNPQKNLELAYAITTHKSQGSEYERVLYVMNSSRSFLLNRKNFYTGISRARKHVTVITDQKALSASLNKRGNQ